MTKKDVEESQVEGSEVEHTDEEVDHPMLDGAEEHIDEDVDPRKGMSDPALIRDIESGKKTANPYG